MKRQDFIFWGIVIIVFSPFFWSADLLAWYNQYNKDHAMVMAFVKFAILATLGESIGCRISTGIYGTKTSGYIPKAFIWGILGLTIQWSFVVMSAGTQAFLASMVGITNIKDVMAGDFTGLKLLGAFVTSLGLNIVYAPWLMTLHKITDMHIASYKGSLVSLFKPIQMGKYFKELNWGVQYGFVFKKTIPFFWIPAHTITFLLPPDRRILWAAVLGIVLGIILAIALRKK